MFSLNGAEMKRLAVIKWMRSFVRLSSSPIPRTTMTAPKTKPPKRKVKSLLIAHQKRRLNQILIICNDHWMRLAITNLRVSLVLVISSMTLLLQYHHVLERRQTLGLRKIRKLNVASSAIKQHGKMRFTDGRTQLTDPSLPEHHQKIHPVEILTQPFRRLGMVGHNSRWASHHVYVL
jgi:hypothetical protein